MNKKVLYGIGAVVLLFLVWRIYTLIFSGDEDGGKRGARPPVAVTVDSVRHAAIEEIRQYTGTIYPLYQYVVAPKISGRIIEINKRIGDWVNSGETIAKIDAAEYQQAVLEAEANLRIAQASLAETQSQLELAQQERERVESLQAKGIASPSELDAAVSNFTAQQSRFQLTQAQVEQREASLKSSKIRLGYTQLDASKQGYIGERFVDEGALLAPNSAIVSIVGIDSVIVRTTIIEKDYGRIQKGQDVAVIVDAFSNRKFYGKVSRIAPMLQEASRVAQMEVEVANDSTLLKPGMFARVEVKTADKKNTQIVPSTAVITRAGESGVFLVRAGETIAHYFPVHVGIVTSDYTEIISPKLEGLAVTLGQHLLEEGSPVILANTETTESGSNQEHSGKE